MSTELQEKVSLLDRQIQRRTSLVASAYSLGLLAAVALYVFFPFQLSRAGSLVLMIALGYMIWKVYEAGADAQAGADSLLVDLRKVEAQIRLLQSLIYNLPFVVGANLFFMGLPGTGSAESKAWLDCYFLLGTVIFLLGCYFANQQTVRKELLPLRRELQHVYERAPSH